MELFDKIPERFFSVLTSSKTPLYIQALFVIKKAFDSELFIKNDELVSMLIDQMETSFQDADFTEEENENQGFIIDTGVSGKIRLLLRRLKVTGWIDTRMAKDSFDEEVFLPDYAIKTIDLLLDLSTDRVKEYNSYVYTTYAALDKAKETPEYLYQALRTADQNTHNLVEELKSLYNNIVRYFNRMLVQNDVNELLAQHFEAYKSKILDNIYYPLKTIDSVPRFKNTIIHLLNEWLSDEELIQSIVSQGIKRKVYENSEQGYNETMGMIHYIIDTYDHLENLIAQIDEKHEQYTSASVEKIRYAINSDRSIKGKLIELLKNPNTIILDALSSSVNIYRYQYFDSSSLYNQVKVAASNQRKPLAIPNYADDQKVEKEFLISLKNQYGNQRIDNYLNKNFLGRTEVTTSDLEMSKPEEFILFLFSTIRAQEKSSNYTIEFLEGNQMNNGYTLPRVIFRKKEANNV